MNLPITAPAGFLVRLVAVVIDVLIVVLIGQIIGFFIGILFGIMGHSAAEVAGNPIFTYIGILIGAAYHTWGLGSAWQATPGKRMMRIFVANDTDKIGNIGYSKAFLRYLACFGAIAIISTMLKLSETPAEQNAQQAKAMELQSLLQKSTNSDLSPAERQQTQQAIEQRSKELETDVAQLKTGMVTPSILFGLLSFIYIVASAIMVGSTPENTAIHDKLVGTRAVRGRPTAPSIL